MLIQLTLTQDTDSTDTLTQGVDLSDSLTQDIDLTDTLTQLDVDLMQVATDCNENIRRIENELKLISITRQFPNDDVVGL